MAHVIPVRDIVERRPQGSSSREVLLDHESQDLVFAVVGHVGSGASVICESLKNVLEGKNSFAVYCVKASEVIKKWAQGKGKPVPGEAKTISNVNIMQDLGDTMRKENDTASVIIHVIQKIKKSEKTTVLLIQTTNLAHT